MNNIGKKNTYALIACAFLFVWWYVNHTGVSNNSLISAHAQLKIDPPFVFRFLFPKLLALLAPAEWLDTKTLRITFGLGFTLASIWLMPAFCCRVFCHAVDKEQALRVRIALLLVLVAHYALPRPLKVYYVYDLPAVFFLMVMFLMLTDKRHWMQGLAILLAPLMALNRETIVVAPVLAFGWHWAQRRQVTRAQFQISLAMLFFTALCIALTRSVTAQVLQIPASSSFSWTEDGTFRLFANLHRIFTKPQHALALLWFGAGAIIWLPRRWRQFSPELKAMLLASTPLFVLYSLAGNIVELRMFSEYVPVLAIGFAWRPEWNRNEI